MDIVKLLNGTQTLADADLLDQASANFDYLWNKLCDDRNNIVFCLTMTLKPKFHSIEPRKMRRNIIHATKEFICKTQKAFLIRTHYEFTKNNILHTHSYCVGRRSTIARYCANMRNFGFVKCEQPNPDIGGLTGWIEYLTIGNEKKNKKPEDCNAYPFTTHQHDPPPRGGRRAKR